MSLDISAILVKLSKERDKVFVYKNKALELETVFAVDGGLPILVKRANLLSDFLFGESLKVQYKDDPNALTGEIVEISDKQDTFVLVMLLFDVIEEMFINVGSGKQVELS